MSDGPLLSVSDLSVTFRTDGARVRAVDGASFDVGREEALCLVGESGAGKTVLCETITGLVDATGVEVEGSITFDGNELTGLSERNLRKYRGSRIGHVFQNPQGALDPVYTVGRQVREAVQNGTDRSKSEARDRALELLDRVELPDPASRARDYPHELSGGMKQRVVMAIALAGDPDLLIADEPTTALDVTTESSMIRLLSELQDEMGMSMLYVTHDLGIVSELADRVTVMYSGKVMETGGVFETFERPAHPYTQALLRCRPGWGDTQESIGGQPPDPRDPPEGCRFHPRCPHAIDACTTGDQPPLYDVESGENRVSCVFHDGYRDASVVRSDWELPSSHRRSGDGAKADGSGNGSGSRDEDDAEPGSGGEDDAGSGSVEATDAETGPGTGDGSEGSGDEEPGNADTDEAAAGEEEPADVEATGTADDPGNQESEDAGDAGDGGTDGSGGGSDGSEWMDVPSDPDDEED